MSKKYPPFDQEALAEILAQEMGGFIPDKCPWGHNRGHSAHYIETIQLPGLLVQCHDCDSCGQKWSELWIKTASLRDWKLAGVVVGHPGDAIALALCLDPRG